MICFNTVPLWDAILSFNKGQWSDAVLMSRKSCLRIKSDSQLGILLKPVSHAPFKKKPEGCWKEKVGRRGRGGLESLWCVKMNRGVVSIYFHEAKTSPWSFFSLSKLTYHNFRNVFVVYSVKKRQFRRHNKNTLPYNNALLIQTGR